MAHPVVTRNRTQSVSIEIVAGCDDSHRVSSSSPQPSTIRWRRGSVWLRFRRGTLYHKVALWSGLGARTKNGPGARDLSRRNAAAVHSPKQNFCEGSTYPRRETSSALGQRTFLRTKVRAQFAGAAATLNVPYGTQNCRASWVVRSLVFQSGRPSKTWLQECRNFFTASAPTAVVKKKETGRSSRSLCERKLDSTDRPSGRTWFRWQSRFAGWSGLPRASTCPGPKRILAECLCRSRKA